jgi:hypothetical protein
VYFSFLRLYHIRPKCKLNTDIPPCKVIEEIKSMLSKTDKINGKIIDNQIYLMMPEKELHYWSPELRLTVKENKSGATINGVAGPNGKVWATFLVFYGLAIMLLIFGGILGLSQWMLNINSVWLWSIPASVILYILIFVAAKHGQQLGRDQLLKLRYFLDRAVTNAENKQSFNQQDI